MGYSSGDYLKEFDMVYKDATMHVKPRYTITQEDASSDPQLSVGITVTKAKNAGSMTSEFWTIKVWQGSTYLGAHDIKVGSYSAWETSSSSILSKFTLDFQGASSASFTVTLEGPGNPPAFEYTLGTLTEDAPAIPSVSFSTTKLSPGGTATITVDPVDNRYVYDLYAFVYCPLSGDSRAARAYIAQQATGSATYQFTPDPDAFAIGIRGKGNGTSYRLDHASYYTYYIYCYIDGVQRFYEGFDARLTYPSFGDVTLPEEITAGAANTITLTGPGGYGYSLILTAAEDSVTAPALTETGSWTPAASAFAPLMPDSMSKTFSCKVQTYYHSVLVGLPFALSDVTVRLREIDVCPQPTAVIEDDAELRATYGDYVLLQSRLHITASAGLRYGATLETLKIIANGTYYTGAEAITEVLESLDYDTVAIEVTDSRGVTAVTEYTISIVEWFTPRVTALAVHRCTSAGVLNDSGDHVLIEWGVSFAPVNDHNTRVLTVHHPEGSSVVTLSAYQQTGQMIVAADTEHSYNISLTLQDAFATFTRTVRLSTAGVILDILSGGKGVAFGKVAETQAALEVCPDWTLICQTLRLAEVDLGTWMQAIEQRLERGGI